MKYLLKKFFLVSCLVLSASSMMAGQTSSLNGTWKLSFWKQPTVAITSPEGMAGLDVKEIDAQVPGNVELDMVRAGLIEDPMVGSNVDKLRPYEGYQWCYTRSFTAPQLKDGQRLQLRFGGIDCLADIWLNGKHVGKAENMMIEHDFDVTSLVNGGENKLQVIIRSAFLEGEQHMLGPISIGNPHSEEGTYLRKAPHMFGWDILPRLVSAGLWRGVELQVLDECRIRDVNYMVADVDVANKTARVIADLQVCLPMEKYDQVKAEFVLKRNGKEVYKGYQKVERCAIDHQMHISNAEFWWPRGLGEAALYDATVNLVDVDGTILATRNERIGLRKVRLERNDINTPEKPGKFRFYVNDVPVFIHGTNWVPADALHSRDSQHYEKCLEMAVDLNCNMIRCWGGNVYEDHRFYDLCDENGIMIWQDFTMGCSFYPQRDDFAKSVENEIISVVCKLRNHPCIALWAGNNEDDICSHWRMSPYDYNPNSDRISRQVLPRVIYEFDPTRPYLASSPYISQELYEHGSKESMMPEAHLWGPRGYYKADYYVKATNQFVSEIGYHGCPNLESLKKMMTPDNVYPWKKDFVWNDEWACKAVQSKSSDGQKRNNLMINQVRNVFGNVPTKLDDFIFASQAVQAEAMKYFVEMWRGKKFDDRSGIIWWNLRDGWPIISDAIVDYYYSKKMAYYFIRQAQHNVCVIINDAVDGGYPLKVINDTQMKQAGEVTVMDVESGKQIFQGNFEAPENGKALITSLPQMEGMGILLITYKVNGETLTNHYLYGNPPYDLSKYRKLLKKAHMDYGFIKS